MIRDLVPTFDNLDFHLRATEERIEQLMEEPMMNWSRELSMAMVKVEEAAMWVARGRSSYGRKLRQRKAEEINAS